MVKIIMPQDCCGCGACVQVCPKHCIVLKEDKEGFSYPFVNTSVCIACNLCEKVCPLLDKHIERKPQKVLALKNRNEEIKLKSSSGGVFYELASSVIKDRDGFVFGAVFDENWEVHHVSANTINDIRPMMGSKYVQSRIENTYAEAKRMLQEGKTVLFSGCPCQIAGLHSFLHNKSYENLITVDFLCHGVPSPIVWREYLKSIQKKRNKKNILQLKKCRDTISQINFREKGLGWRNFRLVIETGNDKSDSISKKVQETHKANAYMQGFLRDLYLRPSCHACKFKRFQSHSDITLADYWGIYRTYPDFNDDKGVSMLFLNSEKGADIYESVSRHFDCIETSFEDTLSNNGLKLAVFPHKKRSYFFRHFHDRDIQKLISYCIEGTLLSKTIRKIKNKIS